MGLLDQMLAMIGLGGGGGAVGGMLMSMILLFLIFAALTVVISAIIFFSINPPQFKGNHHSVQGDASGERRNVDPW